MKLARYWSRDSGEAIGPEGPIRVSARGWSDESLEGARRKARELAQRVAQRLARGEGERKQYLYGERPLPEPTLHTLAGAIVTRNAYGALVLNANEMMFVDVDRKTAPQAEASAGGLVAGLMSLFGRPAPQQPQPATDPVIEQIRSVGQRNGLSGRIYETAAGYRAIITSGRFDPDSAGTETLLKQFGSDPLYIRLCKLQDSFRARLTPKPWRCGLLTPPVEFPFETPQAQASMDRWVGRYDSATARYATCRFVGAFGSTGSRFDELIRYHDEATKAHSGLELA